MFVSRWVLWAGFFATVILNACAVMQKANMERDRGLWTSSDPLSIPFEIRWAQHEKNNLAPNPSFEEGPLATFGSVDTVTIRGWQIIGRNIEWVDTESAPYASDEVSSGRHAVKISRSKAGELDEAEGIVSDYIPVIPGNYSFTYDVRIQNLSTGKSRFGVRLSDAFVVKVLFYNVDKKPIHPARLNPVTGTPIDNSDKSYSFANYWSVDRFPWGTVRARTYNYPFSEGDLPDDARYVRLFFGLKGTGTMWLDNVDYRYAKWNFTALERLKPYFEKHLMPEQRLIPTPKRITRLPDVTYWNASRPKSRPPLILLPPDPAPAEQTAANMLQKKIRALLARLSPRDYPEGLDVRIADNDFSLDDIGDAKLVFSIGQNGLYHTRPPGHLDSFDSSFNGNPQGYFIASEQTGGALIVFLVGASPVGTYYAATTAAQLLDDDEFIYHNATVVDFPDFLGRSYTFRNWRTDAELRQDIDAVEQMSRFKLNKVYAGNNRKGEKWYQSDPLFRRGIQAAGRACRANGVVSLALMVNPYSHLPFEGSVDNLDPQARRAWLHSDPQSLAKLKSVFDIGLAAGAGTIMLHADDHVPHKGKNRKIYTLYDTEDKKRFINLQNAQAHVINRLKQWLDQQYPGTRFEFCPPWYANEFIDRSEGRAEVYFKELIDQIPPDIVIVWTGPTVRSLSVDMADLNRYASLIQRWPMLWDNTLYARNIETRRYGGYTTYYPGKVRMCNLFEPYDTYKPKDFQKYNDGGHLFTNGDAFSEIYKIKYATVADYEWNTSAYNPELSLWKVLTNMYGLECAKELLLVNDAYYALYGRCLRMEYVGVNDADWKKAAVSLTDLSARLYRLSVLLTGAHPLLKELTAMRDKQAKRFRELSGAKPLKSSNE